MQEIAGKPYPTFGRTKRMMVKWLLFGIWQNIIMFTWSEYIHHYMISPVVSSTVRMNNALLPINVLLLTILRKDSKSKAKRKFLLYDKVIRLQQIYNSYSLFRTCMSFDKIKQDLHNLFTYQQEIIQASLWLIKCNDFPTVRYSSFSEYFVYMIGCCNSEQIQFNVNHRCYQ